MMQWFSATSSPNKCKCSASPWKKMLLKKIIVTEESTSADNLKKLAMFNVCFIESGAFLKTLKYSADPKKKKQKQIARHIQPLTQVLYGDTQTESVSTPIYFKVKT